ncbi:MAG TPA: phytanoyl-CoA dioxygenase family protein [Mycobacteriales bacterium]|nr:phytanoyl-CoA dioxygenase family protein [Mycobacteriales bacterium]
MDESAIAREWQKQGFVVLPGWIPTEDLAPARQELETVFPSADGFHDGTDPRGSRFVGDEFAGIDTFPFASVELSLLAVNAHLVRLAELLLGEQDLRIYSAEAWAKYTAAADYAQAMHRDYLGHTLVVPTDDARYQQLEMFVFLADVSEELGPPHMLSRTHTQHLPARPNWYPPDVGDYADDFVAPTASHALYEAEIPASGPAGTVVAFQPATFHRGTALRQPGGARYSMHLSYRPAHVEWAQRQGWASRSHEPAWYAFAARATPRQLTLFGFPPPGHPYWTPQTLTGVAQRYPDLDLDPWRTPNPPA